MVYGLSLRACRTQNSSLHRFPETVLRSRADSMTKKYVGRYVLVSKHNISVFPVQSTHISLYLDHIAEATSSKSATEEIVKCSFLAS